MDCAAEGADVMPDPLLAHAQPPKVAGDDGDALSNVDMTSMSSEGVPAVDAQQDSARPSNGARMPHENLFLCHQAVSVCSEGKSFTCSCHLLTQVIMCRCRMC